MWQRCHCPGCRPGHMAAAEGADCGELHGRIRPPPRHSLPAAYVVLGEYYFGVRHLLAGFVVDHLLPQYSLDFPREQPSVAAGSTPPRCTMIPSDAALGDVVVDMLVAEDLDE